MAERKALIVTGAAGGLGAATTRALLERGAAVLAVDLDAAATAHAIGTEGDNLVCLSADVSDSVQVEQAVQTAVERFGRVDALFNNAATLGPSVPIRDYTEADFRRVLDVNVTGVWLFIKAALPELARHGGRIVNTSSIAGLTGWNNLSGYTASKHAVVGLTRALAVEAATQNVTVNALCPGSMDTDMLWQGADGLSVSRREASELITAAIPRGAIGGPDEVAQTAAWLLLDAPTYLTGAVLPVDGGQTAT